MILIAFDGSPDARAAVERAAQLFPDQPATVLTVWEPFGDVVARTAIGFGMLPSIPNEDDIDEASQKAAEKTAAEGAELAAELGMSAAPNQRSALWEQQWLGPSWPKLTGLAPMPS